MDGDLLLLSRIIRNLVDNAIKVTSAKHLDFCETKAQRTRLSVCDDGRISRARTKPPFFSPLYDSMAKSEGPGLGLSIVRQLCD